LPKDEPGEQRKKGARKRNGTKRKGKERKGGERREATEKKEGQRIVEIEPPFGPYNDPS